MALSTARKFFEGIQLDLREALSSVLNQQSIYLISVPKIDPTDHIALQIVPGRMVNKGPRSASPLIEVEFEIFVWLMSHEDYGSQDVGKLIDDTWSAYKIIDIMQKQLIGSDAAGEATITVQYLSTDKPITNPGKNGWVSITEHYRASFAGSHR